MFPTTHFPQKPADNEFNTLSLRCSRFFFQTFVPAWEKSLLRQGEKKRNQPHLISMNEMITIWVAYHQKGYRTFKWFYQQHVQKYWRREFPHLLIYNRFVELLPKVIVPLTAFMKSRSAASQGIAFIDSTSLCVCKKIRIPRHRTFASEAGRGKSSTGWFYNLKVTSGFKLHLIVNDRGEILSFCITPSNVDDRKPVPRLAKALIGKLFGDRGYISKKLAQLLANHDVHLITTLKNNMKTQAIDAFDQLMLRKRSIIETINDPLKNIFDLEHSRHRSLSNFLSNVVAALIADSYQEKKPSLNLQNAQLLPFLQPLIPN